LRLSKETTPTRIQFSGVLTIERTDMMRFFGITFLVVMLSITGVLAQQSGDITGTIVDEATGESLIGVNVLIETTSSGAATDLDGKFTIRRVPEGSHTIRISSVGYAAKTIQGVAVKAGAPLNLNISLTPEAYSMQEVVVQARAILSSENAVLAERKKAATIGDGISAEQIKRAPDATSGDALKRVTGISVVENKFVYVRGITDRYNSTLLDGASVTSTESGKKSFSFDLIPSNLLEYTSVIKSATPDLPGDFSGGLVQMNTLDFPNERVTRISFGSNYNTVTTSRPILTSQGGSKDWIGIDDGGRSFPGLTGSPQDLGQRAANNWAPASRKAPCGTSLSVAIGDRLLLSDDEGSGDQIGFIGALSYKDGYQREEKTINDLAMGRYNVGTVDKRSVLWGAIANFSYKFSGLHKLSFKSNFNQSADDRISRFTSEDQNTTLFNQYTFLNWTERSSFTGQLIGEHVLPALSGSTLHWHASVSSSARQDPDTKWATYYRDLYDPTQPFTAAVNQRSWERMNERSRSLSAEFSVPLGVARIKAGGLVENRFTNFNVRYFSVTPDYPGGIPDSLTHLPLESIYAQSNYGRGKFLVGETSKANDSYDGDQALYAGFAMMDLPFSVYGNEFRFVGGARLENWEQIVNVPRTLVAGGPVSKASLKNEDILPSANLTYLLHPNANLRLAYSQSVNRPQFREMASTGYYDFIAYELVGGNANLQRSFIHNYDARLEFFPAIGEVFAISFFRKNISGAIEENLIQSSVRTRSWFNSDNAVNSGWELEMRKTLGFVGDYFDNFSITGNYTRIMSRVDYIITEGNSSTTTFTKATRPLQGQSPYMMNLTFSYTEPQIGTSVNILYNKFGRRLDKVGFLTSDIYEEARDVIDVSVTQQVFSILELKLSARNLTAKDRVLTRDNLPYEQATMGTTWGLQCSVKM
jgi:outer membrane receptor protein involved in Fe transport